MAFEDWKKDETGNITVNPLAGYGMAVFAETTICAKLDFLHAGDEFESPSGSVQLGMTPLQAIELAQALQRAADKILSQRPTGTPS